jgi:hypothetical protein
VAGLGTRRTPGQSLHNVTASGRFDVTVGSFLGTSLVPERIPVDVISGKLRAMHIKVLRNRHRLSGSHGTFCKISYTLLRSLPCLPVMASCIRIDVILELQYDGVGFGHVTSIQKTDSTFSLRHLYREQLLRTETLLRKYPFSPLPSGRGWVLVEGLPDGVYIIVMFDYSEELSEAKF